MCEVSKLHTVAVVLADSYFPQDHFYCQNGGRGSYVWFSACMCRVFLGVFTLQRKDYCRFTRPEDNEQTHLWDTFSISSTMKHH